jgi:hypothetical protein
MDTKRSGERLSADEANELARAGRNLAGMTGRGVKVASSSSGVSLGLTPRGQRLVEGAIAIRARNISGAAMKIYQPVTLAGHFYGDTELQSQRVLQADIFIAGDESWFGVCADPIPVNGVGRVYVCGVCLCWVKNPSNLDRAEIEVGSAYLIGSSTGSAQIIWPLAPGDWGASARLALIRFPVPVGGGGNVTVKYATTAALTPSGATETTLTFAAPPSVDGSTPAVGESVLVKNQTGTGTYGTKRNGAYTVGAGNVWTREGTLTPGMLVSIRQGTRNSGGVYVLKTESPITLGTTAITFANRAWNEHMSVKAAATTKATPADGITISAGERLLVVSGADVGGWEYDGANWTYLDKPITCDVQQGATYGLLTVFLNAAGTAYVGGNAVYG